MSCKTNVTPAIAFVDLATFDELHAYLHGGAAAVTYFVRSVKKANWFSFVPIGLRHVSGTANFGEEFSASVNRSGDYVLNVWLRVKVPQLYLASGSTSGNVRWTHNFMHNLVKKVNITFNELCVHEFDSCWLDFNHYFRTRGSKRVGYDTMIGEVSSMVNEVSAGGILGDGGYFNLPLPLFFCEDSGIALPVAALPFNDIKINYCLRSIDELLVTSGPDTRAHVLAGLHIDSSSGAAYTSAKLEVETLAHYAVIHNDERVLMGKAPRDIHIHQVQLLQEQDFLADVEGRENSYDLRFSHAVHFLAWGARNITRKGELSQWSTGTLADEADLNGFDPIAHTTLIYENTNRVDMGSDYYSTVVPWYWCDAIPDVSGVHGYSYSLEAFGLDPKGSTGYSKLANVSICSTASSAAATLSAGDAGDSSTHFTNSDKSSKFRFCLRARNHNIVRISGGSLGLPVL